MSLNDKFIDNWKTEANLPVIEKNKNYDFLLLGSSHARIFSRYNNHLRVEKILNKSFINLSQGGDRGGIINQQIYLKYFFQRGNSTKVLLYFVDPYIFFNQEIDDNEFLYKNEPFRLDFSYLLLTNRPKNIFTLTSYLSKFFGDNKTTDFPKEYQKTANEDKVSTLSASTIDKRIESLYKDSYRQEIFNQYFANLMETINIAKRHNARVVIITPSTLLPTDTRDEFFYKMISLQINKKYEFYDYSHSIQDLDLYYDTDHLNTQGVITFTENFLKKIL